MTSCTPLCTPSATNTPGAGPGTVASCPIRDAGETGRPLPLGRDHTGNRNTMPARLVRATFPFAPPRPSGRCAGRFSLSPAFSPAELGTAAPVRVPGDRPGLSSVKLPAHRRVRRLTPQEAGL